MMVNIILQTLLVIVLLLQIVELVYMLICQVKRRKEDKEFWRLMGEALEDQINRYNELHPNDPIKLEEDNTSEQDK